MSRSERPSVPEIRSAFELVYECCELGADPTAWREHLLHGLITLVDGDVAIGGRADWGHQPERRAVGYEEIRQVFGDVGWSNDAERQVYHDWLAEGCPADNPMQMAMIQSGPGRCVVRRPEVVDDRTWRRAPLIDLFRNGARIDEAVASVEMVGPGQFLLLVVQRATGRPSFRERQRALLEIVHDEVRRQLGRRLSTFDEPGVSELPPRLRDVLCGLLQGDAEKQIAHKLHLSPHTVHSHVKRLHAHFDVHSRGELLARCWRFLSVLNGDAANGNERNGNGRNGAG